MSNFHSTKSNARRAAKKLDLDLDALVFVQTDAGWTYSAKAEPLLDTDTEDSIPNAPEADATEDAPSFPVALFVDAPEAVTDMGSAEMPVAISHVLHGEILPPEAGQDAPKADAPDGWVPVKVEWEAKHRPTSQRYPTVDAMIQLLQRPQGATLAELGAAANRVAPDKWANNPNKDFVRKIGVSKHAAIFQSAAPRAKGGFAFRMVGGINLPD